MCYTWKGNREKFDTLSIMGGIKKLQNLHTNAKYAKKLRYKLLLHYKNSYILCN